MRIYRAMCKEEYDDTLRHGKPSFTRRYKWFSHDLDWIRERVQDGKFNNSKYKKDRYEYLLCFDWDGEKHDHWNRYEIQFDRRRNPKIDLIGLVSGRFL